MTKVFLALKYEGNEKLKELIQSELRAQGVEPVTGEEIASNPPPPVIRNQILASDGLLAVITTPHSEWVNNEVGMAYAAKKPICALIEADDPSGGKGIIPFICKYRDFSRKDTLELKKRLVEILPEFAVEAEFRTHGVLSPTEILASTNDHSNRVSISVAVRPRQIPNGDELLSIYVPPQFDLSSIVNWPERFLESDLPNPADRISFGQNTDQHQYPYFWFVRATLSFPDANSWLKAGWFSFRLSDVCAPKIAGTYRFYGTDDILIEPVTTVPASPFEFHPITVNGEVTPASLSGTLFLSDGSPLTLPDLVRAIGTAVDPWLEGSPSTGRAVEANCYLSSRQKGHYTITGMAPGVYTVYAGALGFSQLMIADNLLVKEPTRLDGHVSLTITSPDVFGRAFRAE